MSDYCQEKLDDPKNIQEGENHFEVVIFSSSSYQKAFMDKMISPVGRGSTNHSADVKMVQKLLNAQKPPA